MVSVNKDIANGNVFLCSGFYVLKSFPGHVYLWYRFPVINSNINIGKWKFNKAESLQKLIGLHEYRKMTYKFNPNILSNASWQ